jgi:DNA repair protein RadD
MRSLRWYQLEAIQSIFDYFKENSGNPIIALPTGTGKSLVIAEFLRFVFSIYPSQRVLKLTHVAKLIQQNCQELKRQWPDAPVGIYSAGLKQRDVFLPIIFGGVQSVAKEIERKLKIEGSNHFGHFDLIIIDEAHLLSQKDDSSYQFVISELKKINPNLKVIGLTATPFRNGQGLLTQNGIFTDICYDLTKFEKFNRLVKEGHLCPLICKHPENNLDVSKLKISCGEYTNSSIEELTKNDEILNEIVLEIIQNSSERNRWVVFCAGIESVEKTAAAFSSYGVPTTFVHSKLTDDDNAKRLEDFEAGVYRCMVNNNKLTTGYNFPAIDMIALLTATTSVSKMIQMLGRGTRPSPDKQNCLVLDHGGNIKRLGPINDPVLPRPPGQKNSQGDAPIKICPECNFYCHAAQMICDHCGHNFERKNKLTEEASNLQVMKFEEDLVEKLEIVDVLYEHYQPKNLQSPKCMKVAYRCRGRTILEYVSLDSPSNFAAHKAREWWRKRASGWFPANTSSGMSFVSSLKIPKFITVNFSKSMPEIINLEYL